MDDKNLSIEYFAELEKHLVGSESYKFFEENIKGNPDYVKVLYTTLSVLPNTQRIKPLIPTDITYLDIVLYAYFSPRAAELTNLQIQEHYLVKKNERKDYYSRIRTVEGKDGYDVSHRIATINLDAYVDRNWLILKNTFKSKSDALTDLIEKVNAWKRRSVHCNKPLTDFPLISQMRPGDVLKLFILDVGCDLYTTIINLESSSSQSTFLPTEFFLQRFVGLKESNIPAEVSYMDDNTAQLFSADYNTIFSIVNIDSEVQRLALQNIENGSVTYPNFTSKDLSLFVKIYNMFTDEDCKAGKKVIILGDTLSEGQEQERRECLANLESIHKLSTYAVNLTVGNTKTIFTFFDQKEDIVSENNSGELVIAQPQTSLGFSFDKNNYDKYTLSELKNARITIYMSPILLEEREKYMLQEFYAKKYQEIKNPYTELIFAYLYEEKKKNPSMKTFVFQIKDIKKIFAIPDMRPARIAAIVDNSLGELKLLGVLEDFTYESKMRVFSVWFAEYT